VNPIRLIIVDDHPVVRTGLRGMLAGDPGFDVVGEATTGVEAVALVAQVGPEVVLMDLRMPEMDGVTAIGEIKAQRPETEILVLTTYDSDADILPAIEAGATGYLLKDAPRAELFRAIRAAARGESALAPSVAARLLGRMRAPDQEALSAREIEVLSLVAEGASNREIGRQLQISEATVKSHLVHIYGKLGVPDRTSAVTTALRLGILHLDG
jgi:DNA-binding NarL/FixJ family response regulator